MADFVKVGKLADFAEGRGRAVELDGSRVAIFRVGGRLRAIQDACPHMAASLADGRIEGGRVVCSRHNWSFDLETGEGGDQARSWACVRLYRVKVEGDDVYLERPEPETTKDHAEQEWPVWNDDEHLK